MAEKLESIEVEGFLSIRSASVRLRPLNVLVGANGAGKSNFIRVFELLGRLADQQLGLFVGLNGGASALLNDGGEPRIRISVNGVSGSYHARLASAAGDALIFLDEWYHTGGPGSPKSGIATGRGGHHESMFTVAARQDPGGLAPRMVDLLQGCRVFHFHDTSADAPVKQLGPTADNLALRNDAGNLAAVLSALRESDEEADQSAYRRIIGVIRQVAPFFRDFVLQPEKADRIRLRWRPADSDVIFSAQQLSDGTLRFICLATLLLSPSLPAVVVLDEPELGLHPAAIVQLAGLLRQASVRSQVLLATQSTTLMNQFQLDDLIVVEREDGASVFKRPDPDKLTDWLNDYSLGELWEKNIIGGQPGEAGTAGYSVTPASAC